VFSPPNYSAPENFLAPRLGPWTVLLYLHRYAILAAVKHAIPLLNGLLLDVGCGNKPYDSLIRCEKYVGLDVESSPHSRSGVDVIYDGGELPFRDERFDSVLCTEVLEHSRDPRLVMREIGRVLKFGGHALITAPMVFHHHEEPHDYFRFTRFGMEDLAKQAGLSVLWIQPRGGMLSTLLAIIYTTVSSILSRRPFIDCLLWMMWPISALLLFIEGKSKREPAISLGWQMCVKKEGARG
jgi:SAM-dependent methyltransferase